MKNRIVIIGLRPWLRTANSLTPDEPLGPSSINPEDPVTYSKLSWADILGAFPWRLLFLLATCTLLLIGISISY